MGYLANANPGGLSNATAIGAAATVSQSNSLVLGGTGTFAVNVGIGTSAPAYPLTLAADDNGSTRGGPHQFMIQGISNPNKQLLIGYLADSGGDLGYGAIQATFDGVANTPLALNPNGGQVIVAESAPVYSNPLQVGQGAGDVVADGYATYSSRRWKTNIKTLPDALNKVERLRGVSYDLKANGKHEVGVIAEEVGAVIPEIVEWDKNGKDANGVDYSRLSALLIEAVKQQQREIAQQNAMLRAQGATLRHLRAQVRDLNVKLTTAAQSGPSQPRLVAER